MARSNTSQLLLLISLAVVALSITAVSAGRPCKTLFVSSYSVSLRRLPHPSSGGFVTVVTEITRTRPLIIIDSADTDTGADQFPAALRRHVGPTWPYDLSSLRDRTKDILSVVVALLFGVGCGALTAATMYLAWSLIYAPRHQDDDVSDDDDVFSPKKVGYVKIPAATDADSAVNVAGTWDSEAYTDVDRAESMTKKINFRVVHNFGVL